MNTERISYSDEDQIRELLLGRTVTKVDEETLSLDDGTILTIVPNEGCGGCGNGWYSLSELNECPVNAVMNVEFEWGEDGSTDHFRVFVLAQDRRILLIDVEGYDNGYYGSGYWIDVKR